MANYDADVDAEQEQIFDRPDTEYKIYVNCLPPELDEVAIREVFNQYGRITGIFYPPKASWAYITYNSYREAECAIRELNDRRPLYLKVTLAKEKSVIKEEGLQRSPVSETSGGRAKDATAESSVPTYNDAKHQQSMGRGRTMNAFCKHLASQMTMSNRSTENELLPSSQASNLYEIEEPTLNTDKLWTKGVITITEDGKRHVTLGRGFTRYEIPKPHPKIEEYVLNIIEKRHNGIYEYGGDKLKNEVQKCLVCSNKTNKHCEKCNTYYCSINCQRNDWPRHKIECQRIPLVEESVKDISLQINKDENQTSIPLTLNKTITSKTIASNEVKLRRPNVSNVMQAESSNNTDANTNMHKNNVDITNYSTNNGINDREHLSSIHDNDTNVCTTKTADQPALSTMNTKDFSRQNQLQRCNNTKEDIEKSKRNDRYSTSNQNHYSRNHNGAIRKTIPDKEKSDNSNLRNKNYNSDRSYQKNELQIDKKPTTIYNDRENGLGSNSSSSNTMVDEELIFCKDTYLSKTEFTEVKILISLDNDEYWVVTLKDSDTRTNLMTKLQDVAGKTRNVQPIIDGVYAVLFGGIWHRAVIISLNPVKVHYLDYGYDETLKQDAEIRGIPRDMIKIPPLARKIRLTPAARYKNFRYDDIIFVKMLSIDAHKTIIVDVREQSEHLFSPVKNASNKNTTEKFVRQENVQASNENLKASKVQISSILNAFADLFTQKAVSELEFTGLIQIHGCTQENIYSASLLIQNFDTELMNVLSCLETDCANAQESAHYKPQVEDLLCGEAKDNMSWYRGYILSSSTSSDLRIIAIDEARIMEVNKIIPCPEKYLNIYAIGVICEVSHPNQLEVGIYPFTGIMNEQNHKQENLKIKIIKDSKLVDSKFEAIIKSWKSMINNSDKSSVAFSEIKSGSQICLTSYRNHYYMFARSLDEEAVEYYNNIMQRVAQCARTAPYLSDPPKNKQAVIAPFSDGNRYRALVIKIQNDKAQIVYTDFGNVDEVNIKELQILPENLALQRSCSAKISLKDVPSDISMNTKVDLFLRELVGNETPLKCAYEGDSLKNGVHLTMPTKESVNDKIKQLLIPTWKQKDQDNTCYMLNDIKVADLGSEGDIVTALILHIQEANIYMMAPFDVELQTHIIQVMPKLLREYCEKAEYYIPRKEELCLALYENEWYRAVCMDPKQSYTTANIFYIDYGNMAEVEHKNIRLMPKDFITPAAMANLCTVVNLAPVDDSGNYSPAIRQKLAELIQPNSIVKIKIVKFSESGDYEIELVDVKKTLIEEGLIPS
ncbi:uncharacterized protein LOC105254637 isoform X2 [Camponotus floridanus]|uniref:uncharacterized protein LOC105254637 isoform X2 n=1 Tax=Camponotus floridanus TaxID=104421 RepID=UPI000DC688DC|nr:uncharacterized protein LOC105254637 isoform X2 [Camponotus floridanus]